MHVALEQAEQGLAAGARPAAAVDSVGARGKITGKRAKYVGEVHVTTPRNGTALVLGGGAAKRRVMIGARIALPPSLQTGAGCTDGAAGAGAGVGAGAGAGVGAGAGARVGVSAAHAAVSVDGDADAVGMLGRDLHLQAPPVLDDDVLDEMEL